MKVVNKEVHLDLATLDGNAFVLLGAFRREAKREGWTEEEISAVSKEAKSSDYDHLLQTLFAHCTDPEDDDTWPEDEDEE